MNKKLLSIISIFIFFIFAMMSVLFSFVPGKMIAWNFWLFFKNMMTILPVIFILIGLFEVWVPRKVIEDHMGTDAKFGGYLWGVLLASFSAGGMFVSFPIACALYRKGANLKVIFFYVSCAGLCRIPMTLYEASFLGIKFTLIRLAIAIPLLLMVSIILGTYLEKNNYILDTR